MEDIAQAVAVPYRLGNLIHEDWGSQSYRSKNPQDENGDLISSESETINWGSKESKFMPLCNRVLANSCFKSLVHDEGEICSGSNTCDASLNSAKKICRTNSNGKVFDLDRAPVWGYTSICGRRPEMEDDVAVVPGFSQIPIQMLMDDCVLNDMSQNPSHLTAHFFGVYDGHGGSQVYIMLIEFDFSFYVLTNSSS